MLKGKLVPENQRFKWLLIAFDVIALTAYDAILLFKRQNHNEYSHRIANS